MNKQLLKKQVIEKLQTCFDPEIPIDLWNLGLIYDIKIIENNKCYNIDILMTLTTPGCSMINIIAEDVKNKVSKIENKYIIIFLLFKALLMKLYISPFVLPCP